MPTIGWFEILIVVAIAIIVLGPKDFPIMLKKVGSWIGTAKRYINNIQSEVSNLEIDDEKIDNEIKKEIKKDEQSGK
tara:strand:+ start:1739 stop:1969 length:231 start_codon:yes stop_codon:yes gene_type:complete